jgi:2-keto-myo-inositol isomerase
VEAGKPGNFRFRTALNSSTMRSFGLDIPTQLRLCREAGYEGMELWMREISAFAEKGGELAEVGRISRDLGIEIFNCIGFLRWADSDPSVRRAEMEAARREMQMLREIGCPAMAAPPCGDTEGVTIEQYAERFRQLHLLGSEIGVEPLLEVWGHRGGIRTVRKSREILTASGVENGRVLLDPIHVYKGGGGFGDIEELEEGSIGVVHVNDFTLAVPREQLADRDRRFPGEGDADLPLFGSMVFQAGYRGFLSLELFTDDYGKRSAAEVLDRGLRSIYRTFRDLPRAGEGERSTGWYTGN